MIHFRGLRFFGEDNMRDTEHLRPVIRPFQIDDLNGVLNIERQCFSHPWLPNMFEALYQINPDGFYVALLDEKIVGYGILLIEQSSIFRPRKRTAHLMNLAVHPHFRNRGIGKGLIHQIMSAIKASDIEEVYLEVRTSNKDAIAFYEKLGFNKNGFLREFYGDENAVVMSKSI
jgi:ribosomal-protein-alanine N-acetyltransferase